MDTSTSPPVACPRLGSLPGTMLALLSPLGLMALFRRTTEPAVGLPVKALFLLPFGVLTVCWLYLAFAAKPQHGRSHRFFWAISTLVCLAYAVIFLLPVGAIPYGFVIDPLTGFESGTVGPAHTLHIFRSVVVASVSAPAIWWTAAAALSIWALRIAKAPKEISASSAALAAARPVAMTAFRKYVVLGVFAVVVGGHLGCVILRKEAWPYSNYPMYSWVMKKNWSVLELDGIPTDPDKGRFVLSPRAVPRAARRMQGIERLEKNLTLRPTGEAELKAALATLVDLYETSRRESGNGAIPIRALELHKRFYERRETATGFEMVLVRKVKLMSSHD